MPNEAFVVSGGGTQGAVIVEWLRIAYVRRKVLLTDDNPGLWNTYLAGLQIVSPEAALAKGRCRVLAPIGDNQARARVLLRLREQGHYWERFIHPDSIIAPSARVDPASIVLARAVVNTAARVGAGCLIDTGAIAEHHCRIGDFVHLAPGSLLGGGAQAGDGAFLGLGAVVLPGISAGACSTIGAGAVLLRNSADGEVMAGNPARHLKNTGLTW